MKKVFCLSLVAALILLPGGVAYADDGTMKDRVVIGHNFTLQSGEIVDGDVVVIGGETAIQTGATVQGDLVVIGGSLRMDGLVVGSAIVIGGSVSLGEASTVGKDLVALGGAFQRAEGSRIEGDIITNLAIAGERGPRGTVAPTPTFPATTDFHLDFGPLAALAVILMQALGLGALGMLLTAFLQPQLDRVAHVAEAQPFAAGSFGLLTVLIAPLAIALMAITLILIPLALAAAVLLALAGLFGVLALGHLIGEKLTQAMHRTWEPVLTAGFGAFILGIILGTSNQIPCVGWLASVLIGLLGLGAVTMTMFGTRLPNRGPASASPSEPRTPGAGPLTPVT